MGEVNVPLLRKAVEWAEAEAAKPQSECAWYQGMWSVSARELGRKCGTCYCIAGFVAEATLRPGESVDGAGIFDADGLALDEEVPERAAKELGIPEDSGRAGHLFYFNNSIEDVRRIAEEIAGEKL